MSRREGSIYVGRLSKNLRTKDVEEMFEPYGRLLRCDIKYGSEMAYAFIDFETREDAEDCVKFENGREVNGQNIIVEWAKGEKDRRMGRRSDSSSQSFDECFRCRRRGHWARDCPEMRMGRRGGGGGGGGGGGRWRSPSPRRRSRSRSRDRRRRSRSRSRDRRRRSRSNDRKRSRSRSGDRKRSRSGSRRSRSASKDRKTSRRSRSRSLDNKKPGSTSKSKSRSKSPRRSRSGSKSKSRSRSPIQKLENHSEPEANGKSPQDNTHRDDDGDDDHREDYGDQDGDRRSRSTSKD